MKRPKDDEATLRLLMEEKTSHIKKGKQSRGTTGSTARG